MLNCYLNKTLQNLFLLVSHQSFCTRNKNKKKRLSQVLSKREAQCGLAMTRSDTFIMPSISPSLPVQTRFSTALFLSSSCNINTRDLEGGLCLSLKSISSPPPLPLHNVEITKHGRRREKTSEENRTSQFQKRVHERQRWSRECYVHLQRSSPENMGQMGGRNSRTQSRCSSLVRDLRHLL